jgi:hypothetical protein
MVLHWESRVLQWSAKEARTLYGAGASKKNLQMEAYPHY